MLERGVCHIWWAHPGSATETLLELLDEQERQRHGFYRERRDRDRFLVACGLVRLALGHQLRQQPASIPLLRDCTTCGRPHGKPRLPPWFPRIELSVAHGGDRIAVALAHGPALGVDVEPVVPSLRVDELTPHFLAPAEAKELEGWSGTRRVEAALRYWTRKEAVVKATGKGLAIPLRSFAVTGPGDPPGLTAWPPMPGRVREVSLYDLHPGVGHVASLAVLGPPLEVLELDGARLLELVDGAAARGRW
jgi:4'-phosphopantetheinyl transferase